MNRLRSLLASLLVGVLTFLGVTVAVTEALAAVVWPSLMLGVPAGVVAGVAAVPLVFFGTAYWAEQRATGHATERTRRRLSITAAAIGGFVGGSVLTLAVVMTQAVGLATAILFGAVPVGLVSAALAAVLVARRLHRPEAPSGSSSTEPR